VRILAVPVRSPVEAKARLAPALDPLERAALTLAMLEDVLDATDQLSGWTTWVVSPDEAVLEIAARRGATPVNEMKPPLLAAIRQIEVAATEQGAEALAVLLGDTPLVTTAALTRAVHTLGPVVIAPDSRQSGTNLLIRRPPKVIPARFGPDSFSKHIQSATSRGVPAAVVELPELAFDLDTPDDILWLLRERRGGRTADVLNGLAAPERIGQGAG
jgi:2-phospho-L-lactate guanylyltransferase